MFDTSSALLIDYLLMTFYFLLIWVQKMSGQIKIRPDHKLFLQKKMKSRDDKINEVVKLIDQIELINN